MSVTVARGFRQVVAGMNYKLVVILTVPNVNNVVTTRTTIDGHKILGGFEVTIYDRFGELSVTQWGQEVTRDEAKTLLENKNAFGEAARNVED